MSEMLHLYNYVDANECSDSTHNCDQICINTNGGFNCSCVQGYALMNDWRSCEGIASNFHNFKCTIATSTDNLSLK